MIRPRLAHDGRLQVTSHAGGGDVGQIQVPRLGPASGKQSNSTSAGIEFKSSQLCQVWPRLSKLNSVFASPRLSVRVPDLRVPGLPGPCRTPVVTSQPP